MCTHPVITARPLHSNTAAQPLSDAADADVGNSDLSMLVIPVTCATMLLPTLYCMMADVVQQTDMAPRLQTACLRCCIQHCIA